MDSIRDFFKRMKQRPSIYLVILLLSLIFSAIEAYNPIVMKYGSFEYVLKNNYMEKLSDWTGIAQEFLENSKLTDYIGDVFLYVLFFAVLVSFVLSGYINVLISSVDGRKKKRGEFGIGIKRNFFKVTVYVFFAVIMVVPFLFLMLYSVIPALATIMMFFDGNTNIIFLMLILAILTIIVMLFALLFYGLYFTYVLPAIAGMRKKSFRIGIKMANTYCWYLMPKTGAFMFFDALIRLLLMVIHYGHQSTTLSIIVLGIAGILRSILFYIYIYFAFNTFVAMRDDLYPDYREEEEKREKAKAAARRARTKNNKNGKNIKQPGGKAAQSKEKIIGDGTVSRPKEKANNNAIDGKSANNVKSQEIKTMRRHTVKANIDDVSVFADENRVKKAEDEYDDSFEP